MAKVPMLPKEQPAASGWNILGVVAVGAVIAAFLIVMVPTPTMRVSTPGGATSAPLPTYPPLPTAPRQDEPPGAFGISSLPSCASVADTRTACEPVEDAPAAAAEPLPTEPPAPTATPPYLAACWTEPGQRPCWLPPDAPWRPLADVPATPLVAVEEAWHAPLALPADVCADWRPPAPWPEECE